MRCLAPVRDGLRAGSPAAYLVILGLALAGCSTTASSGQASASGSPTASPSSASASASATAGASASPSATVEPGNGRPSAHPSGSVHPKVGPYVGTVGTSTGVALPSGLVVSVPDMKTYPVGRRVMVGVTHPGDTEAVLTVSIRNVGKQPVDVTLGAVDVTIDGQRADGVSISDHPTDDHFPGTVLPGKTVRATFGYIVKKAQLSQLQVEVWPTQSEPHAILTVAS